MQPQLFLSLGFNALYEGVNGLKDYFLLGRRQGIDFLHSALKL
jgi:hypothetical protein